MKLNKIFIWFLLIIVIPEGHYSCTQRNSSKGFIKSFLKELELEGASLMSNEFFITDSLATPAITWGEFQTEYFIDSVVLSNNKKFEIWKNKYLNHVVDYIDVSLENPSHKIETLEKFHSFYDDLIFTEIELENLRIDKDIHAIFYAYTEAKSGSKLSEVWLGSTIWSKEEAGIKFKYKCEIIARNGSLGWKIIDISVRFG